MTGYYSPELDELRFRARRLISGDFRVDDLSCLFLAMRGHDEAGAVVKEIGDLVAHRFRRKQGVLKNAAQERFDALVVAAHSRDDPDGPVPLHFWEALRANRRGISPKKLRKDLGLSPGNARVMLREIEENYADHINDGHTLKNALSTAQNRLVNYLREQGTLTEPFTDNQLIGEINAALKRYQISSRKIQGDAAKFLILFAISQMHNTVIQLDDGGPFSLLQIHPHADGKLTVFLQSHAPWIDTKANLVRFADVYIMTTHFSTNLPESRHCDIEALREPDGYVYSLEVTSDLTLSRLK